MKKNRYRKALKVLKSKEIDSKLKKLEESPTVNTKSVYSLNPPGFRIGIPDPPEVYYPDADGNWPEGIPGTPGENEYVRPGGYWSGGSNWDSTFSPDFSQEYLKNDPTGRSTEGLIKPDGTVMTELPPDGASFILGPLVDGFVPNHGYDAYTNIGYIQKDTRQFVLLARITGVWKAGIHDGSYSVWNGTSTGLTIYNQNFTLEMAQWMQNKINEGKWIDNVPYFYSGGVPQRPQGPADCPFCPPGMYGGFGFGAGGLFGALGNLLKYGLGGTPSLGTKQGDPQSGDSADAGLFGLLAGLVKDTLQNVGDTLNNIYQAPKEVLEYVFENTPQEMISDAIEVAGKITGLESAANMLNAYNDFLGNPTGPGSSPSNPYDATEDIGSGDMAILSDKIYNDPSIPELIEGLRANSYSDETVTVPGLGTFSEKDVKISTLESNVHNAVNAAVEKSLGLNNSLHNNVQADVQKTLETGQVVLTKEYVFRPGGSVEAAEKNVVGQVLTALGVELDTAGGGGGLMTYVGFAAAAIGLSNSQKHGSLYKSPGMHYEVVVPPPNKNEQRNHDKKVLTESHRKILREIKKPVVVPELPKKYKFNFSGKYSPQNTPDKTASPKSDELVASGNARGQRWRTMDKYWQGYETTERMNVIYDRVGHGDQAWERIIDEAKRKNGWRNREIQEQLNIRAHELAMLREDPNYISPFVVVEEVPVVEKDPTYNRVRKHLKKVTVYPDKPSKKGYPDTPPQVTTQPYKDRSAYYNKLDPQSASAMPGGNGYDPDIDSNNAFRKVMKRARANGSNK